MKKYLFFIGLLMGISWANHVAAQITVTYPVVAVALTHGYGQSNLTVQLGFTGACAGATVTVALPSSVTYVPGSISQTASTISGSTITESNIANLNAPVFNLNGVTGAGNITFTISRKAGCGNLASGKDTIRVTGSCGTVAENDPNINVYNLFSPVLSLTAPAPATNANIGDVLNRNTIITNGGNGCADTIVFYTVQSSTSLQSNSVTVGGLPVSSFRNSGDTTWYKVYGSQLSADNLLCNGENFTVVNNVTVLSCTNPTTSYGAGWGTNANNVCQTATGSSVINLSTGQPLLVGTANATAIPTCANAGGRRTFTFSVKNTGTARAYNISFPGIGMVALNAGAYTDTASVMVKLPGVNGGVAFHPTGISPWGIIASYCAGGKPQAYTFSLPTGYSLAPGDSIVVIHDAVQCSSEACGEGVNTNWSRIHWDYKDQCGNAMPYSDAGVYPTMNALATSLSAREYPAMIFGGSCFNYSYTALFLYQDASIVNSYREVKLTLPSGTAFNTVTEQNGVQPLAGYPVQNGDTIILRYANIPAANTSLVLKFNLCTTPGTCGSIPISTQVRMVRDTTCADRLTSTACGTDLLNYLGCPGPCPDGGAGLVNFVAGRTTYGQPDNDNDGHLDATGSVDISKIELNRYRPGDVMKTHYVASVGTTATNPSWAFMFSEWTFPAGKWQTQGTAAVTLWKSGSALYTLTGISANDISAGAGTKFSADWSTQLAAVAPGFTYTGTSVDSVVIDASFKFISGITNNMPVTYPTTPSLKFGSTGQAHNAYTAGQLSQVVYTAQATPAVTRFSCLTALYNYSIAGEEITAFGAPYPIPLYGCGTMLTTYGYISYIGGQNPARYFPYEYRPMSPPDTLEFAVPAGWNITGYSLGQTLMNNPVTTVVEGYAIAPYVHTTGSIASGWQVLVDFKSAYAAGAVRLPSEASHQNFVVYTKPTCATPDSAMAAWHYSGNITNYPDSANQLRFNLSGLAYIPYNSTQKPVLTLQNNTGTVQGVQTQQIWDVQVNNLGAYAAPNLWMALEDGSSSVNIDSVVLMPSNVVLSPIAYGSGNKMYQVSAAGLAGGGTNQQARVYFKYTNCAPDSIKMLMGYDCDAFPADPAVACQSAFQYLKVIPANSQVQLSIGRQPGNGAAIDLCTTDSIVAIVNSAEAGNLIAPYVNVYPPAGVTLQTPVSVEYPIGSGNYQNATVTSITGGYKIDLTTHTAIGANGLPGTILNPSVFGRQASIGIKFTTTCGITSGTSMTLSAFGNKPCGAGATGNGTTAQTTGVSIVGATTSGSAGITIGLGATNLTCGGTTTLTMSTVPVTTPTQDGDTVIYTLPAGLSYNGNFVAGTNCSSCTISTSADPAGTTSVKVALQPGVAAGAALGYTFDVMASGAGCGALTITATAKRTIAPLVCGVTPCSGSSAIIGNASSGAITLDKPNITINSIVKAANSNWYPGGTGNLSVSYANTGTQNAPAGTYQIEFFCGASTTPFATRTLTHALLINASATDTFMLSIPTGSCVNGDLVTGKVQAVTNTNVSQCICNPQSFTMTGQPLPIRFTYSKANSSHCVVSLDWAYAVSEKTRLSSFVIERSSNGSSWEKIAALKSDVTRYEDIAPASGKWYYRIGAQGSGGEIVYSSVLMALVTACDENTIRIYPNPTADKVHIVAGRSDGANGSYVLSDALGRTLQQGALSAGTDNVIFVQQLLEGNYFLKAVFGSKVHTQKIRVQR